MLVNNKVFFLGEQCLICAIHHIAPHNKLTINEALFFSCILRDLELGLHQAIWGGGDKVQIIATITKYVQSSVLGIHEETGMQIIKAKLGWQRRKESVG